MIDWIWRCRRAFNVLTNSGLDRPSNGILAVACRSTTTLIRLQSTRSLLSLIIFHGEPTSFSSPGMQLAIATEDIVRS